MMRRSCGIHQIESSIFYENVVVLRNYESFPPSDLDDAVAVSADDVNRFGCKIMHVPESPLRVEFPFTSFSIPLRWKTTQTAISSRNKRKRLLSDKRNCEI